MGAKLRRRIASHCLLLWAASGCSLVQAQATVQPAVLLADQSSGQQSNSTRPTTLDLEFTVDGQQHQSIGEAVVEYGDGSLLFLTPDGRLWTLKSEQIQSRVESDVPMQPDSSEEIYDQFRSELPPGFSVHKTRHYVLVYNTSDIYVKWVAQLFEQIHRGFYNYWDKRRVKLQPPRFPLVAVVFSDKPTYLKYGRQDIGKTAEAMIGYYNMKTNRMITYDLTGVDGMVPAGGRVSSSAMINSLLSNPKAERTVATIVHEAVHQLAFNSGLQVRLADNPLWLSEGLAMFFESPDRRSKTGWRNIGNVNYHNLQLFRRNLANRKPNSLTSLLCNDDRFSNATQAAQAYPESWALTYFLLKTKNREFASYIGALRDLEPLAENSSRERLELFREHFGDPDELEQEFLKYATRIR